MWKPDPLYLNPRFARPWPARDVLVDSLVQGPVHGWFPLSPVEDDPMLDKKFPSQLRLAGIENPRSLMGHTWSKVLQRGRSPRSLGSSDSEPLRLCTLSSGPLEGKVLNLSFESLHDRWGWGFKLDEDGPNELGDVRFDRLRAAQALTCLADVPCPQDMARMSLLRSRRRSNRKESFFDSSVGPPA